ncbi:hypothetical protein ROHU_006321 [Labeo rohita]|uniref:Uncharacterized protein n=1 Tax=Labeo rohita TaxID=84645 RepID=A0A498MTW5_LABRO|nr:hypothetical protein ROHU_006321 [Labeo rohita]
MSTQLPKQVCVLICRSSRLRAPPKVRRRQSYGAVVCSQITVYDDRKIHVSHIHRFMIMLIVNLIFSRNLGEHRHHMKQTPPRSSQVADCNTLWIGRGSSVPRPNHSSEGL